MSMPSRRDAKLHQDEVVFYVSKVSLPPACCEDATFLNPLQRGAADANARLDWLNRRGPESHDHLLENGFLEHRVSPSSYTETLHLLSD